MIATAASPWYKHLWPWILIGILTTSVCLSLTMVSIAVRNPDNLVNDNYYEAGKGINRSLDREMLAQALNLHASMNLDELTGEVQLQLSGDSVPASLELNLISPTQPDKDRKVRLLRVDGGRYVGQIDDKVEGRRFVELLGSEQGQVWRLFEEEKIEQGVALQLGDEALQGAQDR
ncbi:FixH family protein [Pseudomonas sp. S75]|uniref:FixH family protein n=1 Tax=unclassified Pseudomonas TaxID=196821 RepID=UPI0019069FD5|nr:MULTISPECIES: FixH family protein [unclassified Pseudomonas]MBJ9975358.1 FixH family protein [Pseudomonas sp. S30]MBK0152668.1 FixH family protein [Pseudomonas sp. S75]